MTTESGKFKREIQKLLQPFKTAPAKGTIYGALALVLMLVYLLQGHRNFFAAHFAPADLSAAWVEWWGTLYQFGAAFVLLFLVPLFLLKFAGKEKLGELGLGIGDWKAGLLISFLGLLLIALPGGLSAGAMPDFRAEYPLSKLACESVGRLVVYQLAYGLLYYVAWEAFFRGFVQLGLRPHIGDVGAILVQTATSTLMHIGKPDNEIWAALLAGFVFGAIVVRTRSIWPLVIIHWGLGIATDLSCASASGLL
jgi:CAAX protease family protein